MSPADLPVQSSAPRVERAAPPVFFPASPGAPVLAQEGGDSATAPPAPEPARWTLTLPGREPRALRTTVLVGRNPSPNPDYPSAELVALPDEGRSVSKTHAVIVIEADDASVRDLASTNGTAVVRAGTELTADDAVSLQPGDVIRFGSYPVTVGRG